MQTEQKRLTPELQEADIQSLPNEISEAMEMMRRMQTVNNVREANAAGSQGSFSYSLPQPVYLCQTIS